MSKYTTQVRWIVEMNSKEYENLPLSKRIDYALPRIFDFDFPIWSEEYRKMLERKIILHYINKEIGLETVGLWKLYLEERLNLIMPYYNELYKTASKEFDYLIDVDVKETYEGNKKSTGLVDDKQTGNVNNVSRETSSSNIDETTTGDNSKTLKSLKSDLPQANYGGVDYGTDLQEDEATDTRTDKHIATSGGTADRNDTSTTSINNNTSTNSNTDDMYTRIRKGLTGARSATELMLEYRNSLINIDKLIIEELYDLFMLIY